MVAGIILYCLIKRRLVRCCEKENPAHLLEQGGDRGIGKMAYLPPLGLLQPCGFSPLRLAACPTSRTRWLACKCSTLPWPTNCPASKSNWSSRRPRGPPELPASTSTGGVRNPPLEQPSHPIGNPKKPNQS